MRCEPLIGSRREQLGRSAAARAGRSRRGCRAPSRGPARRDRRAPSPRTLAGVDRAGSPQPIVITTSAACTNSSVSGFGNSWLMSTPSSFIASTTAGLISSPGALPAERTWIAPVRAKLDEPGGHLAAAGVVHADEQHLGLLLRDQILGLRERLQPLAGEAVREHGHEHVDPRARRADRASRRCSARSSRREKMPANSSFSASRPGRT